MCGILGPALLHPPHLFPFSLFFFWKISSVKEVSCHRLGMCVLTAWPQRSLMFVRLNSHQIPGLGVFPSTQGPACKGEFALCHWYERVGGACSLSWSWWAVKLLDSVSSCWCLYQESSCVCLKKRLRSVMSERRDLRSSPLPMEISIRIIRLCSRGSTSLPPAWYWDSTLISHHPASHVSFLMELTPPPKLSVNPPV